MRPTLVPVAGLDAAAMVATRGALHTHGAVLVRPPRTDLDGFERLTHALCDSFHEVGTRQALRQASGDGYTTEVHRSNFVLLGHSEGRYRPYPPPPDVCFFLCVTAPAAAGGETTVVDGAAMLEAVPEALRRRLEAQGVIYECLWDASRWQAEFGVGDTQALRSLLDGLPGVRYTLHEPQQTLHLYSSLPAVTHARDGVTVFANGVLAHLPNVEHPRYAGRRIYANPTNRVSFGDGEPLSTADVHALIDAHDQVVYRHRWQAGEILVLDNTRFMHGREMTAAPCERLLVSRFGRMRPDAA